MLQWKGKGCHIVPRHLDIKKLPEICQHSILVHLHRQGKLESDAIGHAASDDTPTGDTLWEVIERQDVKRARRRALRAVSGDNGRGSDDMFKALNERIDILYPTDSASTQEEKKLFDSASRNECVAANAYIAFSQALYQM